MTGWDQSRLGEPLFWAMTGLSHPEYCAGGGFHRYTCCSNLSEREIQRKRVTSGYRQKDNEHQP